MSLDKHEKIVREITDYVNSYTRTGKEFCELMSMEHRTLQQSFTRLCLRWLEHISKEEYRTDGRNAGSKQIAQILLAEFKNRQSTDGYTGVTLELMSLPSMHIPFI